MADEWDQFQAVEGATTVAPEDDWNQFQTLQKEPSAESWDQFKPVTAAAETLPAVIKDIYQNAGGRLAKLGQQLKEEFTGGEAMKPIGGGLPMLEHAPDESFLAGAGRAAYNAPAGLINAVTTPAGLATVASFAAGQPEIGAMLIAAQLAPGAVPFVKRTAEAATGQLSAGESMEQAFNVALLLAPVAHEVPAALREGEATLAKPILKIAGVSKEDIQAYQQHLRTEKEFQPVTPAGTKVTDYVKQGDVAHVSEVGVTEPPEVPAYATTEYAYPRVNLALRVMPPDVIEAMAGRKPVEPQSVHFDSPSAITETAAEKAMRLTTGEPLKTGAEIAMEEAPMAPAELLSVRLARELADARKSMLAELNDLQQQNAARAAAGQRQDPRTTKKITALTAELSMPTVGVPVTPDSPIELVVKGETEPAAAGAQFTQSKQSKAGGDVPVTVDVSRLDAAHAEAFPSERVGQGGEGGIKGRYERFNKFLEEGKPIEMPELNLDHNGNPQFINGRHRFAVLRDRGQGTIEIAVPKDQAADFQTRFGRATVSPGEVTGQVAEAAGAAAPGELAVGQQQVEPPAPVGVGGGATGTAVRQGGGAPVAGGLARSTIEDQIQRGVLPADALVIGKGWNAEEAAARGDHLLNEGVRVDHVLDALQGKRNLPPKVNNPGDAMAVLQSETRRLAAERAAAQKQYGLGSSQARAAEGIENDWLKNTRPKAGAVAQRIMKAFEDVEPVDLSNYDDLYKKASQFQEGKQIPVAQQVELMRKANSARTARANADSAVTKRQKILDRELPKVKPPTEGDMQVMIDNLVKELTPCK